MKVLFYISLAATGAINSMVKNNLSLALPLANVTKAVQPTFENIKSSKYVPLSRSLYVYVNADSLKKKPEFKSFIEYYLRDVADWISLIGYVPLSRDIYDLSLKKLRQMELDTPVRSVK